MAVSIFAYGLAVPKKWDNGFYDKYSDVILDIRRKEKPKDWIHKTIFSYTDQMGQDCFFIGANFGVVKTDGIKDTDIDQYKQQRDYIAEFHQRVEQYPKLMEALKSQMINYQVIVDYQ